MDEMGVAARIVTVARAALTPGQGAVMLRKAVRRLRERQDPRKLATNRAWIAAHRQDFAAYAMALDPDLWRETLAYCEILKTRAGEILAGLGVRLGGGAYYPMLYFLTRQCRPDVIVETGVAAGYSSQVFLAALARNGRGRLYSSDFPYVRLENAERYIGILVEEPLKSRWELFTKGDQVNLPAIFDKVSSIDLFHYDSDKSYAGRAFALATVMPKMARPGLIVMDDIQDNTFFKDYVERHAIASFALFEFEGKFIGLMEL
jgi:hypothetical protein